MSRGGSSCVAKLEVAADSFAGRVTATVFPQPGFCVVILQTKSEFTFGFCVFLRQIDNAHIRCA